MSLTLLPWKIFGRVVEDTVSITGLDTSSLAWVLGGLGTGFLSFGAWLALDPVHSGPEEVKMFDAVHYNKFHSLQIACHNNYNKEKKVFKKRKIIIEGIITPNNSRIVQLTTNPDMQCVAKISAVTKKEKVFSDKTMNWESSVTVNEEETIHSVPFELVDTTGNIVIVEHIHLAKGFHSLLKTINKTKDFNKSQTRLVPVPDPEVKISVTPYYTVTKEKVLECGQHIAIYGKVKVAPGSDDDVIVTPLYVHTDIESLIHSTRDPGIKRIASFFAKLGFALCISSLICFFYKK